VTPSLGSLGPDSSSTSPGEEPEALATLEVSCMMGWQSYSPPVQETAEQESPRTGSPPPAVHQSVLSPATFSESDGEQVNINTGTCTFTFTCICTCTCQYAGDGGAGGSPGPPLATCKQPGHSGRHSLRPGHTLGSLPGRRHGRNCIGNMRILNLLLTAFSQAKSPSYLSCAAGEEPVRKRRSGQGGEGPEEEAERCDLCRVSLSTRKIRLDGVYCSANCSAVQCSRQCIELQCILGD
jgi:hypothetical protein